MINKERPFFTVAIPTWEINGLGVQYLQDSFNILAQQSFTDFEVVISDHSLNDDIKNLCDLWNEPSSLLNIKYIRNNKGRGKIAPNLNNAITFSEGKYIKILFQDDFLYNIDSLEILHKAIVNNNPKYWIVTSCVHTDDGENMYDLMVPKYNQEIYLGNNTISCPTVLTIKNSNPFKFDETLNWLVDVDYYKKCYDKYGNPLIVEDICAVNRNSKIRTTNMTTEKEKEFEFYKMLERYGRTK